jgi:arsenite methyltransferase
VVDTRECYEEAARSAASGQLSCCAPCAPQFFGAAAYPEHDLSGLPRGVVDSAMGCGHPVAAAGLRPGEVVVDLGCGTGLDALLAARLVGPSGRVIGIDMTEGLVTLARHYAREAGVDNAEFHIGRIERLPLPDGCADVVISNGTISLSDDKPDCFTQAHRVLRPGGRLIVTDFVLRDGLDMRQRAQAGREAGCLTGTLDSSQFGGLLRSAGFRHPAVRLDHRVAAGMYLGLITATC